MSARVPTVNDLRVKLCYICREEEPYDAEGPARPWTHPCNCTLVAHEACLLQWIQSAQSSSSRAPNALKCPQCGAKYELESEKSIILDILNAGNRMLQRIGGSFTLVSVAGVAGVMGSGVYIMLTAYGAWAVRQYVGREMFDMLLTDDPSNWPWTAYLNLPLLPISLISSRLSTSPSLPTLLPILLLWPPSPVAHQWMHHEPWHKRDRPHGPGLRVWPPSPVMFGLFIAPMVRMIYRKIFQNISIWLLGASLNDRRRDRLFEEGQFLQIRIRRNVQVQDENGNVIEEQGDGDDNDAVADGPNADNANDAANVPRNPNAVNLAAAERLVNTRSLGRRIGGALLIPYISNIMGTLLFKLSKHSHILREFLGIKPHRRLLNGLPPSSYSGGLNFGGGLGRAGWSRSGSEGRRSNDGNGFGEGWSGWGASSGTDDGTGGGGGGMEGLKKLGYVARILFGSLWGGTKTWVELDPVWWRNSIGLGLFVVAKDCIYLAHLYLAKRELETRKVKNRDFSNVDIRELDLIPSFPLPNLPDFIARFRG